ncbi:MAG TPA: alpha-N-arabinofuranosidase [Gaiellaceae bacterium]|nr:alpha-N-arabinofuranosidase [Gaiellaceae bacterium]
MARIEVEHQASLALDPAFAIGRVDPRMFGAFVEHMGRCVYTGLYEQEHPAADPAGLRADVLELVRELGVTVVRYPGGNFVSGYRWEDGVGPIAERPRRLNLAWRQVESNEFGLGEFMTWAGLAQVEPMLAVNLGTRGLQEAIDLVEYCNHPGGTSLSDLRQRHGASEPYDVRLWCLGNEIDGPWQLGHKTAIEYGRLAAETAKAMRLIDPSIELVAAGSSNRHMPTFAKWDADVLEQCFDEVDFLSVHAYYEELDGDLDSFLGTAVDFDRQITEIVATCDYVAAQRRSRKRLRLAVDEWNVWKQSRFPGVPSLTWDEAPRLIEDDYSVADAVVVGSLLITLLRHADRVGVACLAQLVNVIAPIRTEPGGEAWRQTIFFPFAHVARYARGVSLRAELQAPVHETARCGDVPIADVAVTYDEETNEVALFAVNRHTTESLALAVSLSAFPDHAVVEHVSIADHDPRAGNSHRTPDRVTPKQRDEYATDGSELTVLLPPLSWNVIRLGEPEAA